MSVPQEIDEYDLVDPVDILTPLEKSGFWDGVVGDFNLLSYSIYFLFKYIFCTQPLNLMFVVLNCTNFTTPTNLFVYPCFFQKATKWSERKEAVAELSKLASTRKIAPGDFSEVCRTLKKV